MLSFARAMIVLRTQSLLKKTRVGTTSLLIILNPVPLALTIAMVMVNAGTGFAFAICHSRDPLVAAGGV